MTLATLILALLATPAPSGYDAGFDNEPAASSTPRAGAHRGEPTLIDFHAQWCGPCKAMKPALAELARGGMPIRSVDVDQEKELARKYGVTAYPTFIVVDADGTALARSEGFQPAANLASLYRQAQSKARGTQVGSRERTRPVAETLADRREVDDALDAEPSADDLDRPEEDRLAATEGSIARPTKHVNPKPWETVVRIHIRLGNNAEGVGSGTIVSSNARETLIVTCAHIFKEDGRPTPPPSQFRLPITVDLFDGVLGGPSGKQVHYNNETYRGEAVDYDTNNDVGLIRIRPGRVLAATRIVPPQWKPLDGMINLTTVGCSEGKDATAWTTKILRANAGLKHTDTGSTFQMIECANAPIQGRSGGGLYTSDGYLAGVCDFADPQHNVGLYAVPQSIYRLLDRNRLTALYDPTARDREGQPPRQMLADGGSRRGSPAFRGQSTTDPDGPPPPSMLKIAPPVLASDDSVHGGSTSTKPWHARGASGSAPRRPAAVAPETEAVTAGLSHEGAVEPLPPAASAEEFDRLGDQPLPSGDGRPSKWKPVRRSSE